MLSFLSCGSKPSICCRTGKKEGEAEPNGLTNDMPSNGVLITLR